MDATFERTTVHVRFGGEQKDIPVRELDIGDLSSEQDIVTAVARHYGVDATRFQGYAVVREPTGNITIRPQAVFG